MVVSLSAHPRSQFGVNFGELHIDALTVFLIECRQLFETLLPTGRPGAFVLQFDFFEQLGSFLVHSRIRSFWKLTKHFQEVLLRRDPVRKTLIGWIFRRDFGISLFFEIRFKFNVALHPTVVGLFGSDRCFVAIAFCFGRRTLGSCHTRCTRWLPIQAKLFQELKQFLCHGILLVVWRLFESAHVLTLFYDPIGEGLVLRVFHRHVAIPIVVLLILNQFLVSLLPDNVICWDILLHLFFFLDGSGGGCLCCNFHCRRRLRVQGFIYWLLCSRTARAVGSRSRPRRNLAQHVLDFAHLVVVGTHCDLVTLMIKGSFRIDLQTDFPLLGATVCRKIRM
mmetsp:Transcript_24868/g.68888  ORF Transcript_24868/g.68888 Transcript_24868/m.68888 type:complete len:336 (-) Transcript_24868:29-1036(-)